MLTELTPVTLGWPERCQDPARPPQDWRLRDPKGLSLDAVVRSAMKFAGLSSS